MALDIDIIINDHSPKKINAIKEIARACLEKIWTPDQENNHNPIYSRSYFDEVAEMMGGGHPEYYCPPEIKALIRGIRRKYDFYDFGFFNEIGPDDYKFLLKTIYELRDFGELSGESKARITEFVMKC